MNNEYKTVLWIEDSISDINNVMHGIFPKLWNLDKEGKKIKSRIFIIGNEYKKDENEKGWDSELAQESLDYRIDDFFLELCQEVDGYYIGNATYSQNKGLVDNDVTVFQKDDIEKQLFEKLKELYFKYDNGEEDREDISKLVVEIIDRMDLEKVSVIAIDAALLNGDRDRVVKQNHTIFSMELYDYFIQRGIKSFIYSKYALDKPFSEKWEEIYKNNYSSEIQIDFFEKKEFGEKGSHKAVLDFIRYNMEDKNEPERKSGDKK